VRALETPRPFWAPSHGSWVYQEILEKWDSLASDKLKATWSIRRISTLLETTAERIALDAVKVQDWLSESIVDLILEWKRNKEVIGLDVVEEEERR